MSVKLRQLAEMDGGYAEMLKDFFMAEGINDYLDMSLEEFLDHCEQKLELMGAMLKLELRS